MSLSQRHRCAPELHIPAYERPAMPVPLCNVDLICAQAVPVSTPGGSGNYDHVIAEDNAFCSLHHISAAKQPGQQRSTYPPATHLPSLPALLRHLDRKLLRKAGAQCAVEKNSTVEGLVLWATWFDVVLCLGRMQVHTGAHLLEVRHRAWLEGYLTSHPTV